MENQAGGTDWDCYVDQQVPTGDYGEHQGSSSAWDTWPQEVLGMSQLGGAPLPTQEDLEVQNLTQSNCLRMN